ncbi:HEAT repeat domain-containing protein [Bythopirellula polymerisocia]|uniref:Amylopullulanase n=1 Tax=Bythopirellula polymerisocia TaxID=2528003 RepID=A0A5C6CXR7_9BACT|nr:HEAT repeat domain-containing protein [Bythopirellula polymerisocia]TWU28354.1 Amylopullulanase precursor [Bythopirellula polymerisocia]
MFRSNPIAGVIFVLVLSIPILTYGPLFGADSVIVELPLEATMAVAFSPNGKQVAVGGQDALLDGPNEGLVLLIDVEKGEQQVQLQHTGEVDRDLRMPNPIRALAYSPDGKVLAVAAAMGLNLWDPVSGKELATLAGYGNNDQQDREDVISIAFSPDGKWLAAADNVILGQPRRTQGRLRLWDSARREVVGEFEIGFRGHVAFLPDGTLLVTDDNNSPAVKWRVTNGEQLAVVRVALKPLFVVDRQGKHAVADSMGGKKLWRIEPNDFGGLRFVDEMSFTGERWGSAIDGATFSEDGRLLLTFAHNGAASIYDVHTQQVVGTLLAGGPSAFSPDGTSLAITHASAERSPTGRQLGKTSLAIWKTADVLDADHLAERARKAATDMVQELSAPQPDQWMMNAGAATMDMLRHAYPPLAGPWMGQDATLTVLAGPQGEAATPILIDALQNPRVNGKQRLLHPLALIASQDPKARTAVIEALRTAEAADVRTMAATMLALLPANMGQEAVPALVEAAVNDESPHVRYAAERTLKELDPKAYKQVAEQAQLRRPVVERVERRDGKLIYQGRSLEEWLGRLSASYMPNEIFGRPSPDEPLAAIRASGPDALPTLLETLKSGAQPIRRAAAAGIGALGPPAAATVEPLLNVIEAANATDVCSSQGVPGGVATEAADTLALLFKGEQDPPARLVKLTGSDNPAARLSAARAIAVMAPGHPRGLPVLQAAFVAVSAPDGAPELLMERFAENPKLDWLRRVIANKDADAKYRIKAASNLALLGEAALPALPEILIAAADVDETVSQQAARAIYKIGPQAVPVVLNALQAASDSRARQRLAAVLCGLGKEGRSSLQEFLHENEAIEAEPIWWAAFRQSWDSREIRQYQTAIREALERAGHLVPSPLPQTGTNPPDAYLQMFQPPSFAYAVKLIADRETPPTVQGEARSALSRAPRDELIPLLPALLNSLVSAQDPTNRVQADVAVVIRRIGPSAISAVQAAIQQAPTDAARRGLLQVLASIGKEGHEVYARLIQLHPEYGRLLDTNRQTNEARAPANLATSRSVTFQVHVPQSTPADDVLYITGNHFALGNWNPKGLSLERKDSGVYEVQVRLPKGSNIQYKITRGSWETVEKDKNNKELPNRILEASSDRIVTIRVAQWSDQ